MPDSSRTFGDIDDIDSAELRTQLKNWIEQEGIETNIQLQMKKNLIEKMSRTALGKKIALKLQTQQGIVLSPLVLVLNTLVAEFLYTQNCHFSLSIFTNEVPFKNTLPDFTRSSKFRLNRDELGEIFEALGIEHYDGLVEKYEKFGTDQGSRSLLYIVFKTILSAVKTQEAKLRQLKRLEKRKTNAQTLFKKLEVEKLHKNVEKLLHRVKAVGKAIVELEKSQQQTNKGDDEQQTNAGEQGKPDTDEPTSSQSLRVCSENVSKLVERLETCTKMFEQLIETVGKAQRTEDEGDKLDQGEIAGAGETSDKPKEHRKTYTEFLQELKNTEHGKKYVAKLQKQVAKLLDKEKHQIETKYRKELNKLELEYEQKLAKALASTRSSPKPTQSVPIDHISEPHHVDPIKNEESYHFMRKIDEKLDQLYRQERNVDGKLATLRNDLQRHEQRQSRYFESLQAAKTKETKLQVLHNVERELMANFEDETNAIIQNAKQTIEQLEKESDKINHSFQRYLRKQREDKRRLVDEKVQIWTRYNDEKLQLNQRELLNEDFEQQHSKVVVENVPIVPETVIPVDQPERNTAFENPFRSFDPLKYLKQSRPVESHMVDVAISTTSDAGMQTTREKEPEKRESPVPTTRSIGNGQLSDALAKDTRELRKSIEDNLQKLDQMSRTYSKSQSSSEKRTFDEVPQSGAATINHESPLVHKSAPELPMVEPSSNRSLDDCSSTELGLSDGEILLPNAPTKVSPSSSKLNTTQDIIDYATQNIQNEQRKGVPPAITVSVSYSDLSISSGSVSGASKLTYDKSQSLNGDLDRISTGARSNASQNSWSCYVRLDILQRILRQRFRFPLITAMNITDIDDKIITRALEQQVSWQQLARRYEDEFWSDLQWLNVCAPDVKLRVTDHIPAIVRFVQSLMEKGFAYCTADGSVYFETGKYERYGKLQKVIIEPENDATKGGSGKRHQSDFALWKASKPGEPFWTAAGFGNGRPGWHIECSTLASHLFGNAVDFHAGGLDLRFPHHENEEAQSCCYHDVSDWVTHWLHTGQLHLEGQTHKMSKSLKNTVSIAELLTEYSADEFRMLCLLSHYRSVIEYGPEAMGTARNVLRKFGSFFSDSKAYIDGLKPVTDDASSTDSLLAKLTETRSMVDQFLKNDFNTASSVLALGELASNVQKIINSPGHSAPDFSLIIGSSNVGSVLAVTEYIREELLTYGLGSISKHSSKPSQAIGNEDHSLQHLIESIVATRSEIRLQAMETKNAQLFKVCDLLRERLKVMNVEVKDHGKTSSWSVRERSTK
uniref:cysteine--tRNA ligase n=1 Tax=Anopheles epiroticus TaxID=199890 RepID=A0A182P7H2_9DIPT